MQIESPRDQRFTSPLTLDRSSNTITERGQSPFILKYSLEERENVPKEAVQGLISYGQKNNCEQEAIQFAKLLEKPILQNNDKAIGDTAIHLYSRQSFLYKDIKKFLRAAEFPSTGYPNGLPQNYSKIYDLLPFCFLLNDHVKQRARREQFKGTVYRSCNLNEQEINEYIEAIGQNRQWNGFTSTTKDRKKTQGFGNVLFLIKLGQGEQGWGFHYGLGIEKYSAFPQQEEVLLFAGIQIITEKVVKSSYRYVITILCVDIKS